MVTNKNDLCVKDFVFLILLKQKNLLSTLNKKKDKK